MSLSLLKIWLALLLMLIVQHNSGNVTDTWLMLLNFRILNPGSVVDE